MLSAAIFTLAACVLCCTMTSTHALLLPANVFQNISTKLLEEKLSALRIPEEGLEDEIYHIDDSNFLTGPGNLKVDLKTDVRPISFGVETSGFSYSLNDEVRPASELDAVVHQVGDYHVLYEDDDRVAAVWGSDLFLQRVDGENLPGVFLNLQKKQLLMGHSSEKLEVNRMIDMADDMQMEEGKRRRKNKKKNKRKKRRKNKNKKPKGRNCRTVKLAVAFDNMLCSRLDNSPSKAIAYIKSVVKYTSDILKRDTCIELRLVHVDAHCKDKRDPYSFQNAVMKVRPSSRSGYILNRFSNTFSGRRKSVNRNVAYFFSGFFDGTGVAGAAFVGVTCSTQGYGWAELGFRPIFTHEMGHTLGAYHSSSGIMRASYFSGMPVVFSTSSKGQISRFLGSTRAKCLRTR